MNKYLYLAPILFFAMVFTACNNNKEQKNIVRWTEQRAQEWGEEQPWIVGANFNPSDASNQLDLWQGDTWNPELIDKELGYAANIGMNTIRVYLHYFPYRDDKENFLTRIDQFLAITSKHKIKPMFIFFDDCWNPDPVSGKQPNPKKHLHNAGWVQSPGREILCDLKKHDEVKSYVQNILERYKNDGRILLWDLFNEPQNTNLISYRDTLKEEYSLALLKEAFAWAREINPSQPITSGVWCGDWTKHDSLNELNKFILENSDVITYHNYDNITDFVKVSEALKRYKRPIICTEYMARTNNSLFETHLPYMHRNNIGAINWGLVAGRTQTNYPWQSWDKQFTDEPEIWFHEIFHQDGTPYDVKEVELFKTLTLNK